NGGHVRPPLRDRRQVSEIRALPTTDEEIWRYSRIAELDLDAFAVAPVPTDTSLPASLQAVRDAEADAAAVVFVRDGHVVATEINDPAITVATEPIGAVEAVDAFGDLHDAHATPVVVRV